MSIKQGGKTIAGATRYHPDLFDFKWADHVLNDASWLRADTFSWQSGAVYQAAYQHLVDDILKENITLYGWSAFSGRYVCYTTNETPNVGDPVYDENFTVQAHIMEVSSSSEIIIDEWGRELEVSFDRQSSLDFVYTVTADLESETVAGITVQFYLADDGHKICPDSEESNVIAIYNATGIAWYYIIDTTNQRFKLPRAKHNKYANSLGVVGNGMALGLTDGTYNAGLLFNSGGTLQPYQGNYGGAIGIANSGGYINTIKSGGVTTDPTKSGIIAQQEQDTDQYKYLYFYVGAFTQTAIENTAGLNAELFNGKADLSTVAHVVTEFQAPTAANNYTWYRKYADGWVEQGGRTGQVSSQVVTLLVVMLDTNYVALASCNVVGGDGFSAKAQATSTTTATISTKEYGSSKTAYINWYVVGQSAN